jgi:hypothetical protein
MVFFDLMQEEREKELVEKCGHTGLFLKDLPLQAGFQVGQQVQERIC